tara:strand:+ start:1258 stop:1644 length:387 start_codon:yes stop_codon:yes gene_type:complete
MKRKRKITEEDRTYTKMAVVAASFAYGVNDYDILGDTKAGRVGVARQTAYWILRKSGMPYTMIAETMGKKCHGSPIHGYKNIENILELDMKNGYAPCVRKALKHYKDFYKKYTKVKMKRKIEELENAF